MVGGVDAVEAWPHNLGAHDAEMDFRRTGRTKHVDKLLRRVAAHDGVVDDHQTLARDDARQRVELDANAHLAHFLRGLDERAADVAVLHDAVGEFDAARLRVAKRTGHTRVGHAEHQVGLDRSFTRKNAAHFATGLVDALPIDDRVGACEIDVFENAAARLLGFDGLQRRDARVVDADDFARAHIAHEFRAHDIEAAGFAGNDPAAIVGQLAQAQRTNAVRVAEGIERRGACEHHGVSAVDHLHGGFDALGKMMGFARVIAYDLARDFRVGVAAEFNALANKVGADAVRVHKRAVVRKRDEHLVDGRHVGLGACPVAHATARGVTAMAHGHFAAQCSERAFIEHLGNQAQVFRNRYGVAIAHRNAGAFLAAMLQGLQAKAGQPRDIVGGGVHSKHRALFFKPIWLLAGKD